MDESHDLYFHCSVSEILETTKNGIDSLARRLGLARAARKLSAQSWSSETVWRAWVDPVLCRPRALSVASLPRVVMGIR